MKAGIASIALLAVVGTVLAQSRSTPSPALLVLSKRDRTLSIVDPATLQVVARMPSGLDPHEVAASTDGKLAYISNYGFGAYNTITVVDLVAQKTLRAIDLGVLHGPHGLDYTGGKLYFTAEANKVVALFADDMIFVFLGPKWKAAAAIFRFLAPTILVFAIANPLSWLVMSLGLVRRALKMGLVIAPLLILAYLVGLPYGPKGVALAYSGTMLLWVVPVIAWSVHGTVISQI